MNTPNSDKKTPSEWAPASGVVARLPSRPWLASNQYEMHFILSANNEILWRADWLPMEILQAMVKAANETAAKGSGVARKL